MPGLVKALRIGMYAVQRSGEYGIGNMCANDMKLANILDMAAQI